MTERMDKATAYYKQTFNCAQSVFTAYRDENAIDEGPGLKLATIFGAGVACTGEGLCGAVSGALMAISLKYGRAAVEAIPDKARTYELGRKFMAEFRKSSGSCTCRDILDIDIGSAEGMKKAQSLKLFETKCLNMVKLSCEILEGIL
jgi:C_GCAxxG_C_C family probable redox protein